MMIIKRLKIYKEWKYYGFNIKKEFRIYQYLSGYKILKKPDDEDDDFFEKKDDWIKHIKDMCGNADKEMLQNMIYFLKLKKCKAEADLIIVTNLELPLFATLITSFLLTGFVVFLNDFIDALNKTARETIVIWGVTGTFMFILGLKIIVNLSEHIVNKHKLEVLFADDCIDILNEMINGF